MVAAVDLERGQGALRACHCDGVPRGLTSRPSTGAFQSPELARMRRSMPCLLVAACVAVAGCKQGREIVANTIGNIVYGGLSEMGDTSRPANERRAAAMFEGPAFGDQLGQAFEAQFED